MAPFTLDYQLNSGDGNNNNTATINNFTFGNGGSATGTPSYVGGASGDLTSGVALSESSAYNEFDQTFTAGSILGFDLSLTTNPVTPTPDQFSFAILDNNLDELGTTDPSDANTIITVNIDSASPSIDQFSTSPASFGTVTVTPLTSVPEPATTALFGISSLAVVIRRRR